MILSIFDKIGLAADIFRLNLSNYSNYRTEDHHESDRR